ncbi:3TM-type holin [Billgrantia gudaonensis]|uniref:Holin of 3TMs, for gene-transfer release n=1 Tax=Billgrantia gudaonensis TaxID=376427 RepID=A0A1G8TJ34_9GAMM|nr:3TM-type holin [Halomonas gudaonensis]SDJ41404.1 Holin of 3TMs, for gene-transfer release [Halomonas gudaonensis]
MKLIGNILGTVAGPMFDVIDKAVTDKDEANRLKAEIQRRLIDQQDAALQAQMKIILAEATGESWAQRNWRPVLMLTIVAIVANNYLLAPYLGAMFGVGLQLELPEALWNLMTLGVGGYIAGRSGEKIVGQIKGKRGNFLDEVDK